MPRWYAPMFHMPMSSPIMQMMLGLSAALAETAMSAAISGAAHCVSIFSFIVFWLLLEKAGGPCEPPAGLSIRLLAFALLHLRLDLLLHRVEVERGGGLHRRVVNRRHGEFCDFLLNQDEAPELARHELIDVTKSSIVEALVVEGRCPLERILSDVDHGGHIRGDFRAR